MSLQENEIEDYDHDNVMRVLLEPYTDLPGSIVTPRMRRTSGSWGSMDSGGVGGSPRTELFDLTENALMSIFCAMDFESLVTIAKTAKKLNDLANDESLWMELCRPWENVVDLKSWRAQMDSGKALFRLLRSFSKLVGIWSHDGHGPHGRLLYVTRVPEGLEGWLVAPGVVDIDYMMFIKLLDVTGTPDGSHKVELVVTDEETDEELDTVKSHIVLPSPRSPNHFVLESLDASGTELERNSNGVRFEIARGQDLGLYLGDAGEIMENTGLESWRILYTRLEFGEPTLEQQLTGLWAGYYGEHHGWEILTVAYTDDGFIVGTKAIGDKCVPCGEISFKACVELESTDYPDGVDSPTREDPSRILTMYKGQGRTADTNFVDPTWEQGYLFVEESGNFRFLWQERGPISFRRLDMDEAFKNRDPDIMLT